MAPMVPLVCDAAPVKLKIIGRPLRKATGLGFSRVRSPVSMFSVAGAVIAADGIQSMPVFVVGTTVMSVTLTVRGVLGTNLGTSSWITKPDDRSPLHVYSSGPVCAQDCASRLVGRYSASETRTRLKVRSVQPRKAE